MEPLIRSVSFLVWVVTVVVAWMVLRRIRTYGGATVADYDREAHARTMRWSVWIGVACLAVWPICLVSGREWPAFLTLFGWLMMCFASRDALRPRDVLRRSRIPALMFPPRLLTAYVVLILLTLVMMIAVLGTLDWVSSDSDPVYRRPPRLR